MINQTDLKYFLELSQTLHLTRAAERIGISQPALSHCLKRLEAEVGVPLFIRSKKGVSLTPAGAKMKQSASELIAKWEEVRTASLDEVTEAKGVLRVGCHTAVAQYALPTALGSFLEQNPLINVQLTHGLSRHMTEQVVSGQLDFAIAVNPVANPDLIIKEIGRDEVCVWQTKNNLNRDVLIVEPSLLQTKDILQKMGRVGVEFTRVIESSSLEVIASLTAAGVGCGVLPERVLKAHCSGRYERVAGTPHFNDRICLIYKKELRKLMRGKLFIDAMTGSI